MVKSFFWIWAASSIVFFALWTVALIDFSDTPPILLTVMLFWAAIISLFFGIVSAALPLGLWRLLKK